MKPVQLVTGQPPTGTGPGPPSGAPSPMLSDLQGAEPEGVDPEGDARSRRKILVLLSVMVLMVSLAFIVRDRFLLIRNLEVHGISRVSWQEVAMAAGLSSPASYFGLSPDRVARGVNSHPYLEFESLEKVFPDTLVLHVRERRPSAIVGYLGLSYLMAEDGVILEKNPGLSSIAGLSRVSGLAVRDIRVGAVPTSSKAAQVPGCVALLEELAAQDYLDQVSDIDVSEPESLYLTTRDGFTIHLGAPLELRAKLGTARAVVQELKRRGCAFGLIEATVPGEATYRPDLSGEGGCP